MLTIQLIKSRVSISSFKSFAAVNLRNPKFYVSFQGNLKMSTKRCVSASDAAKLDDKSSMNVSEPQKTTSKEMDTISGTHEDDYEYIEKMTVQQIKSRLRTIGIPARGAKSELISTLKNVMNNQDDYHPDAGGKTSAYLRDQVVSEEKLAISKINSKRKAAEKDHEQKKIYDANTSAGKRTYSRVKKSFEECAGVKYLECKSETELISESTEIKDEPWTILNHKKPQKGWTSYNPKTMRPPPIDSDAKHVKLLSWNVNGLRALLKMEGLSVLQLAQREAFDILCLQETKLQEKNVDAIRQSLLEGYENSYWTCSSLKLGYSGTAIISRIKPHSIRYGLGISDHDGEGRLVTIEFDSFYLLCGYVPNSGDGLRRLSYRITQWDPSLSAYMKELEQSKPVILAGDLNCAHQEIDIWNPAGNKRSAGFTDEERQSFQTNFLDQGFVDTFRKQNPNTVGFTYWGFRHGGRKTNKGWRLDYFLVSESIANQVYDSYILPDIAGSDHCPIGLILKL